jgi:hypothetical protein
MMNTTFANWNGTFYVNPPGNFPYFFTTSSSPNVIIDLTLPYGSSSLQGATVPMPTNAVPSTNSDAHLTVLNASNGNEYDYFVFPQNEKIVAGETIDVGWGGIVNYQSGSGWGGAATAAGAGLLGGLVTIDELESGVIHHALALAPGCNNGAGSVYPATATASYSCPSSKGAGIPHGSRIWSDLTPAQVAALGLDKLSTMILNALYTYGGFVTDTNGWRALDVRNIMEGPTTSTATAWWNANGGNAPALNSEPASFFTTHFHVLQVCVTQGNC